MRWYRPLPWASSVRRRVPAAVCVGLGLCVLSGCEAPVPPQVLVVEATIAGLQGAIREERRTCREVVQAYLDRIEAYDVSTGLGAIAVVNGAALERADELDNSLREGVPPGPLFCAPLLIKDNFDTHDLATTGGSVALAGSLPPDDAFMVRRLREAGAIVLAKTNMAEWAFSPRQTVSSSYGTTSNAYALDRVPAGSSGGTASGVAASLGVAGMGTDTGNSIRGPSSHLALFGIRSTMGLTSRDGVIPLALGADIAGPMARTVEDAARLFSVVQGFDPNDPATQPARGRTPEDYTEHLDASGLDGARVGVLRALADPETGDADVLAVFDAAIGDLERLGATVVDPVVIPDFDELRREAGSCRTFKDDVNAYLSSLGDQAPIQDIQEVLESGQYSEYVRERLERYLAEPTSAATGEPTRSGGGPAGADSGDARDTSPDPRCAPYPEHVGRQAYKQAVVAAMDEAGVEALIYPTWTHPPAHLDLAIEEYRGDNSQIVAPATGLPAGTVPMGYTGSLLPAGLQILARPFGEAVIFRLAYAYEQGTRHRVPPPGFGPIQ